MLRPKTKRFLQRLLPFGVIWLLSMWTFTFVEMAASDHFNNLPYTAIQMDSRIFVLSSIAVLIVGLLTGWVQLRFLNKILANKSFALRILLGLLFYAVFFSFIILITFPMAVSLEMNTSVFDPAVWERYISFNGSLTYLSAALQLGAALVLSLFYSEMSEFIGQDVLNNFFTGKYHHPVEEERIFMFLDMKSSTTIAEKLGHQAYFRLLKAYYDCFTEAIVEQEAEIYQYVGDEIILSWPFQGSERDRRCIDCFFAMKESLRQRGDWFEAQFGCVPSFKAGLHFGKVTTGEIGSLKKDILFSGDVLNVAARIQALCNTYQSDLLLSGDLLAQLQLGAEYQQYALGAEELRGKQEKKELYSVRKPSSILLQSR